MEDFDIDFDSAGIECQIVELPPRLANAAWWQDHKWTPHEDDNKAKTGLPQR